MNQPFRIEQKECFRILGYVIKTTNQHKAGRKAIPEMWERFRTKHLEETILSLNNQTPYGIFGVSVYNINENDSRQFQYYIAVSSDQYETNDLTTYTIPACTWAIFPCTMDTIAKTEVMAITKWLPKSKYQALNKGYITGRMKTAAPDIQFYGKDGNVEIWIAVKI